MKAIASFPDADVARALVVNISKQDFERRTANCSIPPQDFGRVRLLDHLSM